MNTIIRPVWRECGAPLCSASLKNIFYLQNFSGVENVMFYHNTIIFSASHAVSATEASLLRQLTNCLVK